MKIEKFTGDSFQFLAGIGVLAFATWRGRAA
jgi:hypothetical protein